MQRPIFSDFSLSVSVPKQKNYIVRISDYVDEKLRDLVSSEKVEKNIFFGAFKYAHNIFCASIKEMGGEFFKNATGRKIIFITNWLFAEVVYAVTGDYVVVEDIILFPIGPSGPSGGPSKGPRPSPLPMRLGKQPKHGNPFVGLLCDSEDGFVLHLFACVTAQIDGGKNHPPLFQTVLAGPVNDTGYPRQDYLLPLDLCADGWLLGAANLDVPMHDVWVACYSLLGGIVGIAKNVEDITSLNELIDQSCFSDGGKNFVNSEKDFPRPYASKSELTLRQSPSAFPWVQSFNPFH